MNETTKKSTTTKRLEKINDILITETDAQTKQTTKKKQKLFKFTHEEVDYYTEDQLKYLNNLYGNKLKTTMQNIFTWENPQLKKQLIYTMVCKQMGESNVLYTLKKFDDPDTSIVESLLVFLKNELEESQDRLGQLEHKFKTEELTKEEYEKQKKKLEEYIKAINDSLVSPKEEELTEDKLKEVKDNYEYFEGILKENYQRDLNNRKEFRTSIDFYQKALETNNAEIKISENKKFK